MPSSASALAGFEFECVLAGLLEPLQFALCEQGLSAQRQYSGDC